MAPIKVTPITAEGAFQGDTIESHEAFGMVSLSRCSGDATLFGSEVEHQHFIMLRISAAEVHCDLYRQRPQSTRRLAEVWMSEAQFARMITTLNTGDGVPCTLRHIDGKVVELPPRPTPVIERTNEAVEQKMQEVRTAADEALVAVEDMVMGKTTPTKTNLRQVSRTLMTLQASLCGNIDHIETCLKERMEHIVTEAKTEFEAHLALSLQQRGLSNLQSQTPQLKDGGD